MKAWAYIFAFACLSLPLAASEPGPSPVELFGGRSRGAQVAALLAASLRPDQSPRDGDLLPRLTRETSGLKAEARLSISQYSDAEVGALQPLLGRPGEDELPVSMVSPSGRFRIHYALDGTDAATPDFIEEVAIAYDHVYEIEINQLGYRPPPPDLGIRGPEFDVYVHNIADYGASTSEQPGQEPDRPRGYTSWIEMDNDFTHTPTHGLPAMRVTAAHEFFHMVQIGYRDYDLYPLDTRFLYEMSSTWMEDMVYPEVNDYLYSLPAYFNAPDLPFHMFNGSHEYGTSIFMHMLAKKYGPDVIRNIWEAFSQTDNPFEAIDKSLNGRGSQFTLELADFCVWNVCTGVRADTVRFYAEGDRYPEIRANEIFSFGENLTFSGRNPPLSSKFYQIVPESAGTLTVWPTFDTPFQWITSVLMRPNSGDVKWSVTGGNESQTLQLPNSSCEIWLAPTYAAWPSGNSGQRLDDFQMTLNHDPARQSEDAIVSLLPNPFLPEQHPYVELRFHLNATSDDVCITVYNESGGRVRRACLGRVADGFTPYRWDGRDERGQPVASGIYLLYVQAQGILGPAKVAIIR